MKSTLNKIKKVYQIVCRRLKDQGFRTTLIWVFGRGIPKLTGVPIIRYSQITPQIFIGAQYNQAGKIKLENLGIHYDVNMRKEFDDAAHSLALKHYCYLPTIDDHAPSTVHLEQGVRFIQRAVDEAGKVYIHCAGGVGRAATMAAAYFLYQGFTLSESITLIEKVRPFIYIMPPQMDQLKLFETRQHVQESVEKSSQSQ
jgi:protein-tyrosine phosphatase